MEIVLWRMHTLIDMYIIYKDPTNKIDWAFKAISLSKCNPS